MDSLSSNLSNLNLSTESPSAASLISFLDSEREGAVLSLRRGLCVGPTALEEADSIVKRCGKWIKWVPEGLVGALEATRGNAKPSRLIREDVPRTFAVEAHREVLVDTMVRLQECLGDYSQAMCFVAAFLSIFMPRAGAFALTVSLAQSPKYVGQRWWNRVAFGTEAFTFAELLVQHDPAVAAHFETLNVLPEAYTQRWFLAIGVDVLPYRCLLDLVELFLEHGVVVLHRLGLAIVAAHRDQLLAKTQTGQCLSILCRPKEDLCPDIVKQCASDAVVNDAHLEKLRTLVAQKYAHRLVSATGQDSTRKHTGETSSEESGSDDDDSEALECMGCDDNAPEVLCESCGLLLCTKCHKRGKGQGHSKDHKVKSCDDMEFEVLLEMSRKHREEKK